MKPEPPIHPGEVLREEFLEPLDLTVTAFARMCGSDKGDISRILRGQRVVTPQMALRFARVLGTTPEFWTNLQTSYDLHRARQQHSAALASITPLNRH